MRLIGFGLPNPHQVQWHVRDRTGPPQPFGAPPGHGMIRVIDRRAEIRRRVARAPVSRVMLRELLKAIARR